jgi:hypothetical protein
MQYDFYLKIMKKKSFNSFSFLLVFLHSFVSTFCCDSKRIIPIVNLHLHQQCICLVHGTLEGETQARCR